jgi:hypothetical protein
MFSAPRELLDFVDLVEGRLVMARFAWDPSAVLSLADMEDLAFLEAPVIVPKTFPFVFEMVRLALTTPSSDF